MTAYAGQAGPAAIETAPATFKVKFDTSAGPFVVEVTRAWAPIGADRFYNLVKNGFYDDVRFFRVVPNFMVQFGINGDPAVQTKSGKNAASRTIRSSRATSAGYVTFAQTAAPNSRSTQVFINFKDNSFLDAQGFAPFGQVVDRNGRRSRRSTPSTARSPNQGSIQSQGNAYLKKDFPEARLRQEGDDRDVGS